MSASPDPRAEKESLINGSTIGVGLLIVAFVLSLVLSIRNTLRVERPTKTTIRIAHWQLERGYREALQAVIDEYKKLHPEIDIVQMPVTERLYSQWLNTQLISGQGPDLCEMGMSKLASQEEYVVRYFLPLSSYITDPNPYNADNELRDVPWRDTLLDGMRGGFKEGLQEYYGVPTTLYSMRLFYNKDLLREVLGSDAPPKTFGEWMAQCRKVREYAKKNDLRTLPFVSAYNISNVQGRYEPVFTAGYADVVDTDMDGIISVNETYAGLRRGDWSLDDPAVKALFETIRSIGDQMQQDFSSMDRQQAQFRFVNGEAAFMWTGSWDAAGTISQANVKGFEVGICDLPLHAPGEPNAQYVVGRANEATGAGGGAYGVSRNSKHVDIAIDFMKFFTARRGNALFAEKSGWPALTQGVPRSEIVQAFTPDARGYNAKLNFAIGSRVRQDSSGALLNYYQGEVDYDAFKERYLQAVADWNRGGIWAWWYETDQRRKDIRNKERILAQQALLDLADPTAQNPTRYARTLFQQVMRNNGADFEFQFRQQFGRELPEF